MRIKPNITINVPEGMYCKDCFRKEKRNNRVGCGIFNYPYLYETSDGRLIKCEACLLETRKAIIERNKK